MKTDAALRRHFTFILGWMLPAVIIISGVCSGAEADTDEQACAGSAKTAEKKSKLFRFSPPPLDKGEAYERRAGLFAARRGNAEKTPENRAALPSAVITPSKKALIKTGDEFSNACSPPDAAGRVPKTLNGLKRQMGAGFVVARRGPFLVTSDLNEEKFASLVDGTLAFCRECLKRDYFRNTPKRVITIYIFKNMQSYKANLRLHFKMEPISPYGHYGHTQCYLVVNYDTGPGTMVHELTHSLMAPDFPAAPIWISEGIASLYEQCCVKKGTLKGDPNWRLPELKLALSDKRVTPLRKLFGMTCRQFRSKNESLHYAESRYFCKFMEDRGLLRKVYNEFRDNHRKDPAGIKTIEKAFGKDLKKIESAWHSWLRTQVWK